MKNKKIVFYIGQPYQHRMRFGETADLFRSCYFRGKYLGYEDGNIFLEWPRKVDYRNVVYDDQHPGYIIRDFYKCPSHSILPIKFLKKGDYDRDEFDEEVDLTKPDAFYDGCPPLYEKMDIDYNLEDKDIKKSLINQKKLYMGYLGYLNKYYLDTGERPIFNIKKDKLDKPYILFHVRIAGWSTYRNPDLDILYKIIKIIKYRYGDKYEYWKCGEACEKIEEICDRTFPYHKELDDFLKFINNASLGVCCNSGPNVFLWGLGVPSLEVESPKYVKGNSLGYHMPGYWKQKNGTMGKEILDWLDKDKLKVIYKGYPFKRKDILSYTDKWLN